MKRILTLLLLAFAVIMPFVASQQTCTNMRVPFVAGDMPDGDPYARYFANSPLRETRAVWFTTYLNLDWPTRRGADEMAAKEQQAELCRMLDSLQKAGINTILFQTRLRASVVYESAIEPWDECMTGQMGTAPAYDPLQFAIEECHKRGMELHAWVVTLKYYAIDKANAQRRYMKGARPQLIKHGDAYYLDPSSRSTDDYLSAIVGEIVGKYDVDGISLDYIRYPENARKLKDDNAYKRLSHGETKGDWRRSNITRIVSRLYHDVKAIKPWVKVSSSPVGRYADLANHSAGGWNARDAVYQDAQQWMRDGIHDALFPMMYYRDDYFYPFALDWKENSHGCDVAPGLGIYLLSPKERNWPLKDITDELAFMRQNGMGQCFFRTRFLLNNEKGLYDWLVDFNRDKALPAALTNAPEEKPDKPELTLTYRTLDQARIAWNGGDEDLRYNVYLIDDEQQSMDLLESLFNTYHYDFRPRLLLGKPYKIGVRAMNRHGIESDFAIVQINK